MSVGQRQHKPTGRVGSAGIFASFVIAILGAGIGALSAYLGQFGVNADAARESAAVIPAEPKILPETPRDEIVRRVIKGLPLERLASPALSFGPVERPRIVIILDDMGIDPAAANAAMSLPGPLTLSFLPYARDVDRWASLASEAGHDVMLHLPMEPVGENDPGPNALRSEMSGAAFLRALEWNLDRFDGYAGVNNHMGSSLTTNEAAMKTVLAEVKARDLFFIDSVTTRDTVVARAGRQVGANIISRDVFLDAEVGDGGAVRRQLELVERIAIETGYAVAIGHPHETTMSVLGPWLTSAKARGFDLVTATSIAAPEKSRPLLVAAPDLRG